MRKYYKNCILCGYVDYYCLLCKEAFTDLDGVERHIRWGKHVKALKICSYFHEFRNDFVIKITKNCYYCEVCNTVAPNLMDMVLHVEDERHNCYLEKYNSNLDYSVIFSNVKRNASSVIIAPNAIVSEREWNGLIGDKCIICNEKFSDPKIHLTVPEHYINLIHTNIDTFEGAHFREINNIYNTEELVYCFMCKQLFPDEEFNQHWSSKEHTIHKVANKPSTSASASSENELTSKVAKKEPKTDYNNYLVNITEIQAKENGSNISSHKELSDNTNENLHNITTENRGDSNKKISCKSIESLLDSHKNVVKSDNKAKSDSDQNETDDGKSKVQHSPKKNHEYFLNPNSPSKESYKEIIDLQHKFKEYGVQINIETKKAKCIICEHSPMFDANAIIEHIRFHWRIEVDSDESSESSSSESDCENRIHLDRGHTRAKLAKYGRKRFIALINGGSKGYCTLCDCKIAAHIKNLKQHVKGANHMSLKVVKNGYSLFTIKSEEYPTESMRDYVRTLRCVNELGYMWLNEYFCIAMFNFALMGPILLNGQRIRCKCFLCEVEIPMKEAQFHSNTAMHVDKLYEVRCVSNHDKELIREIKPCVYHCGVCNQLISGGYLLKKHLEGSHHKGNKKPLLDSAAMITAKINNKTDSQWSASTLNSFAVTSLYNTRKPIKRPPEP